MRIDGLGLIDRSRPMSFRFDGREFQGFAGDTLASALLANGVRLFGRSFKYHRPRGILTATSAEPNALVSVQSDGAWMPNLRATTVELHDGLVAQSQNRFPSLAFDLLAVNDRLWPFLGAGFYYKTFMWPRPFWEKLYEPLIRRAAGLGRLPDVPDDTPRERVFAHCDVLVIGAGPAGLVAALVAAEGGADVILADERPLPGGQLIDEGEEIDGQPAHRWAAGMIRRLSATGTVRYMPRTTVFGAYDDGSFGAFERVSSHLPDPPADAPREAFWRIRARRAIIAAGALERPIAFADNDRPGIMLASAVRAYLHRHGVATGRRVAVFANNGDGARTVRALAAAGVEVAALINAGSGDGSEGRGGALPDGVPVLSGGRVIGTRGRLGLRSITVAAEGKTHRIEADCLAVAGGWNPTVHLACHLNGRPRWDERIQAFVPVPGAVPGLEVAGAAAGIFSTAGAVASGAEAAGRALEALGATAPKLPLPVAADEPFAMTPLWHVEGKGRAWLDFQNDVTVKDVTLAAAENFRSVEHMKRYTTQGMATDQGKSSNVVALAVLAEVTGRSIPETGTTTFRPPFAPVPMGAIGTHGRGAGFAPQRRTTSDARVRALGAPMIEAGLWFRPSYFPAAGETTWRESCDREVAMVREAVGVVDVSTLGKIGIQGPDAAAFLDFVYANRFSTLKPGRVRYGLMLREDGHVMDDGTTACLGPGHYLMTTTTAAAGPVMRHLEFVLQGLRPDLDVRIASVTEAWAQFAVAGPRARELLEGVLDRPTGPGELPFMGVAEATIGGVPVRLFRISFSGEWGVEVAIDASHGAALFDLLLDRARALGGGPYGMEALNVLRIEKGFPTHAEMHGRTTAFDLGLERMIAAGKDCIGKTMASREGLLDPARERLVGLRAVAPEAALLAGAFLFAEGARPVRANAEGYVTSAAFSPTLGRPIALGFLSRGPERLGEVVTMVDHLRGQRAAVEVVPPCFFDPDGGRMRG